MELFFPVEANPEETRVALLPDTVRKYSALNVEVIVEANIGKPLGIADGSYEEAGARIASERAKAFASADAVLRLGPPADEDIALLKEGCIHISHLDPFRAIATLKRLTAAKISAISVEMIPRTTIAQKMDALSSQANLAGYVAVLIAAERLNRIFPMMMTPAGTIAPSRVFIIGAGVAGLQAIATAKRLGARVEAFDTRPAVAEQVESLGGRFVSIDIGETAETKNGYARQLTPEQIEKQQQGMTKHCAAADVVITTAQVFGKPAPRLLTAQMVQQMRPGSIIIDMAVETGGNVEGSEPGREVECNGVRIIGLRNLPGRVAMHASEMYAANLYNFTEHFLDKENAQINLDLDNEIINACLISHEGAIRNPALLELAQGEPTS